MSRQDLPEELLALLSLDARTLYRIEVRGLVRLSPTQKEKLLARAREGDVQAKQTLIESCLHYVGATAQRLYLTMPRSQEEYLDLVSIGYLALVECIDRALKSAYPMAFLHKMVRRRMMVYCRDSSWLEEHEEAVPDIQSLDAPIDATGESYQDRLVVQKGSEGSHALPEMVRQAMKSALTPTEREVLIRAYGIDERPRYTYHEIASAFDTLADATEAFILRRAAVEKLRRYLEEQA